MHPSQALDRGLLQVYLEAFVSGITKDVYSQLRHLTTQEIDKEYSPSNSDDIGGFAVKVSGRRTVLALGKEELSNDLKRRSSEVAIKFLVDCCNIFTDKWLVSQFN